MSARVAQLRDEGADTTWGRRSVVLEGRSTERSRPHDGEVSTRREGREGDGERKEVGGKIWLL
jgi:hypothetical protein